MSLKIAKKSPYSRVRSKVQRIFDRPGIQLTGMAMVFALLAVAGVLFQDVTYGEIIITIYGVIALLFGIRSEDTFKMALIALIWIPLLTMMRSDVLSQNFAVYAFLLLCFGVVTAIKEQWRKEEPVAKQVFALPKRYVTQQREVFVNRRERTKRSTRALNSPLS